MSSVPLPRFEVSVVATGLANTASVAAALERCGAVTELTRDPRRVEDAEFVVLPGVGSFGAGMDSLERAGLPGALRERAASGRPLLAICLGFQLLCAGSEESPGVEGLGVLPVQVARFPDDVRVPQLGWNRVRPRARGLVREGEAYFANSFRVGRAPAGWTASETDHGGGFVSALERGAVLACQFHPELSGAWGAELLERWLVGGRERVPCS